MTDAEISRKLERDLLDRKHMNFAFLARSQRTSISYFLEMYAIDSATHELEETSHTHRMALSTPKTDLHQRRIELFNLAHKDL